MLCEADSTESKIRFEETFWIFIANFEIEREHVIQKTKKKQWMNSEWHINEKVDMDNNNLIKLV